MIIEWIKEKLIQAKNKKQHNCIRLQFQIAELQRQINRAKREQNG